MNEIAIQSELISQNIHAIILNTNRDIPAHRFYERLGFETAEDAVILYATF